MLRILVAGTHRCGTAHIAQVLCLMGIPCGHSWVYTPDGARRYPEFEVLGDASPLAAPFVQSFAGIVLHQVRDPLHVIGSLLRFDLFRNSQNHGIEGEFLARHFSFTGDPWNDAMRYYVEWNTRCERHDRYVRYHIEDLNAPLLQRIADSIGHEVSDQAIIQALRQVSRRTNALYNAQPVRWSDLPETAEKEALIRLAIRYRYPVSDPIPEAAA